MKAAKIVLQTTSFLILSLFLLPINGYGYIDLGSGSYIIQLIIAAFVGISFSLKIFWKRIRAFLSKKEKADKPPDTQ